MRLRLRPSHRTIACLVFDWKIDAQENDPAKANGVYLTTAENIEIFSYSRSPNAYQ